MKNNILVAILASVLLLSGCSSQPMPMVASPDFPVESGKIMAEGPVSADRSIISNAYLELEAQAPDKVLIEIEKLLDSFSGRIDQSSQQTNDVGKIYLVSLTIRVPASSLENAMDALKALGKVKRIELGQYDTTLSVVDLKARETALNASVARLQDLMLAASTTAELIEAETALSARQAELQSIQAQLRYLEEQVDLATISLQVVSPVDTAVAQPQTPVDGLNLGIAALISAIGWLGVAAGFSLPFLAIGFFVLLIVRLIWKKSRKKD